MKSKFTQDDLLEMFTNPIYTGMGPYSAIIDADQWICVNTILIEELGAQIVVESVLRQFTKIFPCFHAPKAMPYIHLAESIPATALHCLLVDLNRTLKSPPVSCPYRNLQNSCRVTTDEQAVESFLQTVAQVVERLLRQDETFSHNDTCEQVQ
ncbi:MAG: hypothetical protein GY832_10345 [Chloroflexi bacterium]|nr:hypothetical protein [Chloroflexota bacterium]